MRSNWIRKGGAEHRQMLREVAKEEIAKQKAEFCPECEEQIQAHVIALLCHTLHTMYGFGAKRLTALLQAARGTDIYTVHTEHKSDAVWVEWLRDEMGIVLIPPKEWGE
jgi:hypothetical protein